MECNCMGAVHLNREVIMKRPTLSFKLQSFHHWIFAVTILVLSSVVSHAQDSPFVTSRGQHERHWLQTNDVGEVIARFTEIATGLCRWDANTRSWLDSDPTI